MSETLAGAVEDALPPDNEMVGGVVTAISPLRVLVRGADVNNPGTLGSYIPSVGDPVQMLRQDSTWLCLGSSVSGIDATNTAAFFNDNTVVVSTAGAAYTNVTGASFAFTKRLDNSRVRVDVNVSAFLSVATNTKPRYGLDFISLSGGPSVRVDVMEMLINPLSQHTMISGGALYGGIPADDYTVQLLWLRVSGGGTLNINNDDWVSVIVTEVA